MNKIFLMGRLTSDPKVTINGEKSSARFSLAVNRGYKASDGTTPVDFINCVSFGKGAEFAEKYLKKGIKIIVEGRLNTGSYTNKEGQKVYTTDVIVEATHFCESKATNSSAPEENSSFPDSDGFFPMADDDNMMPFN